MQKRHSQGGRLVGDEVNLKIRAFLVERFPRFNLGDDDDLRELGFVNSLIATEMVAFVESEFRIKLAREDLVMDNFQTIRALARLVDSKSTEVYHPPSGGYYSGPHGYYNRFTHYYPHAYDTVYSPGYVETLTSLLLETNLYRADTRELIWSMSSDTFEPRSTTQLIDSVSATVIKQLKKDQLI